MSEYLDPIIVVGCPRSRTSLITAILNICGLELGNTCGKNPNNPKGQFENREIIDKVQKPYLKSINTDVMGQFPLPEIKDITEDKNRKQKVLNILKKQNVNLNTYYGFKDCKAILDFPCWIDAFPNSKWVIIHRKKEDIAKSCALTSFMYKREDWDIFVEEYRERFELLKQTHKNVYEINSDDVINFKLDKIKYVVESLGLSWKKEKVINFIDPELTRVKN